MRRFFRWWFAREEGLSILDWMLEGLSPFTFESSLRAAITGTLVVITIVIAVGVLFSSLRESTSLLGPLIFLGVAILAGFAVIWFIIKRK